MIRYWNPSKPNIIGYCTTVRFNEYKTLDPNGEISSGLKITQDVEQDQEMELTTMHNIGNPLMKHSIEIVTLKLPPKGKSIEITILRCYSPLK